MLVREVPKLCPGHHGGNPGGGSLIDLIIRKRSCQERLEWFFIVVLAPAPRKLMDAW